MIEGTGTFAAGMMHNGGGGTSPLPRRRAEAPPGPPRRDGRPGAAVVDSVNGVAYVSPVGSARASLIAFL